MRAFIAKHWGAVLAALVLNGIYIWKGIKWLLDWLGRLDLVASHVQDLRGLGSMSGFLIVFDAVG
jgi:hypothetical protein